MKKLLTILATMVIAFTLSVPGIASQGKGKGTAKSETATSVHHGKAHRQHAKKQGTTKGKKEGQEGSNPGKSSK